MFNPSELVERELLRFGKFANSIKIVPLGCEHPALKQVVVSATGVYVFGLTGADFGVMV